MLGAAHLAAGRELGWPARWDRYAWVGTAAGATVATAGGLAVALWPPAAGVVLALAAAWLVVAAIRRWARSWFVASSLLLVGGYVTLTRGFSGIHVPAGPLPLYVGELALAALLLPSVRRLRGRGLGMPAALLLAWMGFNALMTLPHLQRFGVTAIRDAATWYYGLFAVVGAAAWFETDARSLRRWLTPIFVVSLGTTLAGILTGANVLPALPLPLSDAPLFAEKFDTNAMYLVVATVLFLLGGLPRGGLWTYAVAPALVAAAVGIVTATQHRAAFVSLAAVLVLLVLFRRLRPVIILLAAAVGFVGVLWALDVELDTAARGTVSARTVIERQLSTIDFVSGGETAVDEDGDGGTILWRTIWWERLLREQLRDERLLFFGRGYGPDLRDAVIDLRIGTMRWDQGKDEGKATRSPHNVVVTILARSGVIGLALWVALLAVGWWRIARATVAARRAGSVDDERLGIWLATLIPAVLSTAALGVVLESPFGAIPFFFFLGLGVAWAEGWRR